MSNDLDAADVEAALVLWDLYRLVSMPASPSVSFIHRLMVLVLIDRKGVWRPMKSCDDERSLLVRFMYCLRQTAGHIFLLMS